MEKYEYISEIGAGCYGSVYLCRARGHDPDDPDQERLVAVKRFRDAHSDAEVMRLAVREVRLLKRARHRNIVKLHEAFRSTSGRVYVVMEYVERTLTADLQSQPHGLPPAQVKLFMWQLIQAVGCLHKMKIIHRDLKPANILVSNGGVVKLCDFGFARSIHPCETSTYSPYVVTRWYRAPEVLVGDRYGPPVDIWALGCIFAELSTGRAVLPGRTNMDQLALTAALLNGVSERQARLARLDDQLCVLNVPAANGPLTLQHRFPDFPADMLHLLEGCLEPCPTKRVTARQLLALPYFFDVVKLLPTLSAINGAAFSIDQDNLLYESSCGSHSWSRKTSGEGHAPPPAGDGAGAPIPDPAASAGASGCADQLTEHALEAPRPTARALLTPYPTTARTATAATTAAAAAAATAAAVPAAPLAAMLPPPAFPSAAVPCVQPQDPPAVRLPQPSSGAHADPPVLGRLLSEQPIPAASMAPLHFSCADVPWTNPGDDVADAPAVAATQLPLWARRLSHSQDTRATPLGQGAGLLPAQVRESADVGAMAATAAAAGAAAAPVAAQHSDAACADELSSGAPPTAQSSDESVAASAAPVVIPAPTSSGPAVTVHGFALARLSSGRVSVTSSSIGSSGVPTSSLPCILSQATANMAAAPAATPQSTSSPAPATAALTLKAAWRRARARPAPVGPEFNGIGGCVGGNGSGAMLLRGPSALMMLGSLQHSDSLQSVGSLASVGSMMSCWHEMDQDLSSASSGAGSPVGDYLDDHGGSAKPQRRHVVSRSSGSGSFSTLSSLQGQHSRTFASRLSIDVNDLSFLTEDSSAIMRTSSSVMSPGAVRLPQVPALKHTVSDGFRLARGTSGGSGASDRGKLPRGSSNSSSSGGSNLYDGAEGSRRDALTVAEGADPDALDAVPFIMGSGPPSAYSSSSIPLARTRSSPFHALHPPVQHRTSARSGMPIVPGATASSATSSLDTPPGAAGAAPHVGSRLCAASVAVSAPPLVGGLRPATITPPSVPPAVSVTAPQLRLWPLDTKNRAAGAVSRRASSSALLSSPSAAAETHARMTNLAAARNHALATPADPSGPPVRTVRAIRSSSGTTVGAVPGSFWSAHQSAVTPAPPSAAPRRASFHRDRVRDASAAGDLGGLAGHSLSPKAEASLGSIAGETSWAAGGTTPRGLDSEPLCAPVMEVPEEDGGGATANSRTLSAAVQRLGARIEAFISRPFIG